MMGSAKPDEKVAGFEPGSAPPMPDERAESFEAVTAWSDDARSREVELGPGSGKVSGAGR